MREDITIERVNACLRYCPETGKFYHARRASSMREGQEAGTEGGNGYIYISIDRVRYLAHRLAWFISHGEWPEVVDHKNNNPLDNRLCNLRGTTQAKNTANQRIRKDNSTGFKGVSFYKRDGNYLAQIRCNGVYYFLGYHDTPEAAHKAYCEAAAKLFGEFARAA